MPTGISGLYKNTKGAKIARGEKIKQTNFERIKAMSVEEMAKYIYEHDDDLNDVICKTIYPECPWGDLVSPDNCLGCIKKYLESEVAE